MKASRARIDQALRTPGDTRFFLFHGPDESGSRALAARLAAALGPESERIELNGAELRADPARLADEAAAFSLFGGARWILVEPAGDETVPAVEALLESPGPGNPVALVAGALRPASRLLKLAVARPDALAFASYPPEGEEAERLALDLARGLGLVLRPDVAARLAESCAGNRAVLSRELEKLACYADAAPDRPRTVDHDALDAVGAAAEEGDLSRLVDSVAGGRSDQLEAELQRLAGQGADGIRLTRAMLRRMVLLARLRAEVERGGSPGGVMASQGKALFWKDKEALGSQLRQWRADLLAKGVSRLLEAERQVMASGGIGPAAAHEELFAICRQAARLR